MRLAICPRNFQGMNGKYNTVEECMALCGEAGFTEFDFGIRSHIGSSFVYFDGFEEHARAIAEYAGENGYTFVQSHAPYAYAFYGNPDTYRELTHRSFIVASVLGAEYIVIHGLYRPDPDVPEDVEADLERAYEFYAPMAELADRLNLKIAVENLFNFGRKHTFTADVEEQLALIERLDAPHVGACWDTGHGRVRYGSECVEKMKLLGRHLWCTHVHDNLQGKDLHLPPFMGDLPWTGLMQGLCEMEYAGDLTLELRAGWLPEEMVVPYLSYVYRAGRTLISMKEKYHAEHGIRKGEKTV